MRSILIAGSVLALLSSGCAANRDEIKKVLAQNPDIIFDVLEKNPAKFAQVAQKASMESRKIAQQEEENKEKAEREEEAKNPKKPDIGADRAVLGDRNAQVFIVEYSDFQCPYCSRGFKTVEELRQKYGKKMGFMFKHLPLDFHPLAMPAAKAFEAIAMQNPEKAYQFHDEIFNNQQKFTAEGQKFLDKAAKKVGADLAKMKKDMESETVKGRITADMEEARKFGIQGTPGFVVNGMSLKGAYPASAFEALLQQRGITSN